MTLPVNCAVGSCTNTGATSYACSSCEPGHTGAICDVVPAALTVTQRLSGIVELTPDAEADFVGVVAGVLSVNVTQVNITGSVAVVSGASLRRLNPLFEASTTSSTSALDVSYVVAFDSTSVASSAQIILSASVTSGDFLAKLILTPTLADVGSVVNQQIEIVTPDDVIPEDNGSSSSAFPGWGIAIIVVAGCALAAGVALMYRNANNVDRSKLVNSAL